MLLLTEKKRYFNKIHRNIHKENRRYIMKKLSKKITASISVAIVLVSTITTFAATSYANHFRSWTEDGYYKCKFSFIGAHEIQSREPYCSEVGKHVKQAYVIAYNSKESSGRKYSTVARSKYDSTRRTTPTASIVATWFCTEYTKYGYTTFN